MRDNLQNHAKESEKLSFILELTNFNVNLSVSQSAENSGLLAEKEFYNGKAIKFLVCPQTNKLSWESVTLRQQHLTTQKQWYTSVISSGEVQLAVKKNPVPNCE